MCIVTTLAAAEIVIPPQKSVEAERAKAAPLIVPTIILLPAEEDEGVLAPRYRPDGRAADQRHKARQYREGVPPFGTPLIGDGAIILLPEETTADRARENRARARAYVTDGNKLPIERMGSDGIPVIRCALPASSVAGRIGDDTRAGSLFYIVQGNQRIKVRCAP
ncbi:MAG: hypothetical protein Q8L93_04315 [Rhodocyclaceae bacterium]|nr:hypothetical protein [Rhodocyclaceae bacterium]